MKRAWGQTERGVVGSGQVFDFLERTTGGSRGVVSVIVFSGK